LGTNTENGQTAAFDAAAPDEARELRLELERSRAENARLQRELEMKELRAQLEESRRANAALKQRVAQLDLEHANRLEVRQNAAWRSERAAERRRLGSLGRCAVGGMSLPPPGALSAAANSQMLSSSAAASLGESAGARAAADGEALRPTPDVARRSAFDSPLRGPRPVVAFDSPRTIGLALAEVPLAGEDVTEGCGKTWKASAPAGTENDGRTANLVLEGPSMVGKHTFALGSDEESSVVLQAGNL
jgi:hypothetical protein